MSLFNFWKNTVRTRIAPSPTGALHIGTARSALYNWIYAKQNRGEFILRIDDTDTERSKKEYEKDIIASLKWLGLDYDHLVKQSERMAIYREHLEKLINEKKAFYCPHSKEELDKERTDQRNAKQPPKHVCSARNSGGKSGIIRFKNDNTEPVILHDAVRGDIEFDPALFGDFSIARSLDEPLYNLASAVDDAKMNITHVLRGEDHISNTPKHILIIRAFAYKEPIWAHLPLLLGKDRSKLSKRHGAQSIQEFRQMGYLPDAMVNFMALLGWHPSDETGEYLTRKKLIRCFKLEKVQKGGAIFEMQKLDHLNKQHIHALSNAELIKAASEHIDQKVKERLNVEIIEKIILRSRDRLTVFGDINKLASDFTDCGAYAQNLLSWKGKQSPDKIKTVLSDLAAILDNIPESDFNAGNLDLKTAEMRKQLGNGMVLWPLRVALSGRIASPGPFEIMEIIGRGESIARIKRAIEML